jgi:hypothetical protein
MCRRLFFAHVTKAQHYAGRYRYTPRTKATVTDNSLPGGAGS